MYKLGFYVPTSHLEQVKLALFQAGAGHIGNYDRCCWQIAGQGQFRPLAGSTPHIGAQGELETVTEYRVEMVLADDIAPGVLTALHSAHPYEAPAFDLVALVTELPQP